MFFGVTASDELKQFLAGAKEDGVRLIKIAVREGERGHSTMGG